MREAQNGRIARKFGKINRLERSELCQEQKDRPGERSVVQDVLRAAPNVKRAARDEDLRVRYVARVDSLQEASAEQHAKLPAVFDAQVAR